MTYPYTSPDRALHVLRIALKEHDHYTGNIGRSWYKWASLPNRGVIIHLWHCVSSEYFPTPETASDALHLATLTAITAPRFIHRTI